MKKVEHFICEVCNTEYKNKEMALKCEKSHKHPRSVMTAKCRPVTACDDGYPDAVTVLFDDGKCVRYKRG